MRRVRFDILLTVLGAAVLIAIAVARRDAQSAVPVSTYSTYDTGPNGYRALYDVLATGGVAVRRSERELDLLPLSVQTLVISSVLPELTSVGVRVPLPIGKRDLPLLKDFMRRGGRLVVLDTAIGDPGDEAIGLPRVRPVANVSVAVAVADGPLTAGVASVRANVTVAFPFAVRKAVPLLATSQGLAAIAYPFGKGEMIAIAAPDVFSNVNLARADNARFAYDLLATHGPVAFDERVHGYVEDKTFWSALPAPVHAAVWIVVGIVILALIGANVRFAPPIAADPPDERDSAQYLTAMASLLARARAARSAVAAFADDALRRARLRYGLPPQADAAAIALRADRPEEREDIVALEHLRSLTHPDDAQLARAASINARLRKELG